MEKGTKHVVVTLALVAALVVGIYLAWESAQLYTFETGFALSERYNMLFQTAVWAFPAAVAIGLIGGALAAINPNPTLESEGHVERHKAFGAFLQHWTMAVGIVLFAGSYYAIGFLFVPRMTESTTMVGFGINLHFLGGLFMAFAASYHVAALIMGAHTDVLPRASDLKNAWADLRVGQREQTPAGKYRPIQITMYGIWAVLLIGAMAPAGFRTLPYLFDLAPGYGIAVTLQGIFVLLITIFAIIHLVFYLFMAGNRPWLSSMVTGWLPRTYAEKYHSEWLDSLEHQPLSTEHSSD